MQVHGVGTGGCVAGTGKFLKEKNPAVKIIAVEPTESRVHVGEGPSPHSIVGIGAGVITNFFEMDGVALQGAGGAGVVDEFLHASSVEAVDWARKACCLEGMMVGPSAGAALKVAADLAARDEAAGKTIVVLVASHAIRYTSHPLWADVKAEAAKALPAAPDLSPDRETLVYNSMMTEVSF